MVSGLLVCSAGEPGSGTHDATIATCRASGFELPSAHLVSRPAEELVDIEAVLLSQCGDLVAQGSALGVLLLDLHSLDSGLHLGQLGIGHVLEILAACHRCVLP